jgi:hypothetical protein
MLRRDPRSMIRRALRVEVLEDRCVPATIFYSGGNLTVSNPIHYNAAGQGVLTLTQDPATGQFTVMDGTFFNGKYKVTGNITVNGSNHADNISVVLDNTSGNGTLPGNLTINGLNGDDSIAVDGKVGNASERIGGNLTIDGGYGNDQINVGTTAGITIRGNNNTIIGNYGNDVFKLGGSGGRTVIGGALSVYSTQTVNLTNTNILGGQLITLQLAPTDAATEFTALALTESGVNTGLTNAAPVTINGGNLNDNFSFNAGTTLGTTTITDGAGNDALTLNAKVKGNFTYTAGNGQDTVSIGATAAIQQGSPTLPGNLTLTLGNGANIYKIDTGFTVANDFTLNNGNGNLNAVIGATVGHFLSVNTGTGTNNVTLDGDGLGNTTTTFAQFFYSFGGGGNQNTVNFNDDGSQAIVGNFVIPAQTGTYLLNINFHGAPSAFTHTVNLSGGTNTPPPSNTTVNIMKHGDTVVVNDNLQGTKSVTVS